jgi:hypothetical protein
MCEIVALLIEISALTDSSQASWTEDIKVSAYKLLRHVLSQTSPIHNFALYDGRCEDCVSICLGMAKLASDADGELELTRTLRMRVHELTSKCLCMTLHANSRAALCGRVDDDSVRRSLTQQLQL